MYTAISKLCTAIEEGTKYPLVLALHGRVATTRKTTKRCSQQQPFPSPEDGTLRMHSRKQVVRQNIPSMKVLATTVGPKPTNHPKSGNGSLPKDENTKRKSLDNKSIKPTAKAAAQFHRSAPRTLWRAII